MENKQYEEKALMADMAEAEKISEFSPSGSYKKDSVNRFINAINAMLKNFSANPLGQVDQDIEGPLPPDLVKSLMMINSALEDAKIEDYMIDIEGLKSDRDLMMARGKIEAGAKDRSFIAFLRKPMNNESETEVEVNVEMEQPMHRMPDGSMMPGAQHGEEEIDEDELFAARLG